MNFPADWPPCCPPPDAVLAHGTVYRVVKNKPPTSLDFRSLFEEGRRLRPGGDECMFRGLSVFRTITDAHHQREAFPRMGAYVAHLGLSEQHGKMKLTNGQQPSHTTWWSVKDMDRVSVVTGVEATDSCGP